MEIKTCSLPDCNERVYARGLCRKHYRKQSGECKRYYAKHKDDPNYKRKMKEAYKKYFEKYLKGNPDYLSKQAQRQNKYYHDDSTGRKRYLKEWKKRLPLDKKREYYKVDNATRMFGGIGVIEEVLRRHNYKCAICGLSNEENKKKYKQRLSIHHKDGMGRNTDKIRKNNDIDNLVPVCRSCHMKLEKGTATLY